MLLNTNELHYLHNDYPLAPENLPITYDIWQIIVKKLHKNWIKVGDVKKLIPNLGNKTSYVVHYKNVQLYLSLGIKLTKIHRMLKFRQPGWMKKYINFNTEKSKNADNSFEKSFSKLMINSVYGKTMENLRKESALGYKQWERFFKIYQQTNSYYS